jgi:hypothetical protein
MAAVSPPGPGRLASRPRSSSGPLTRNGRAGVQWPCRDQRSRWSVSLLDGSKRGMSPPGYWPPGSPGDSWRSCGTAAPESSAMGRPGSLAAGSGWPPKGHPAGEFGRMPRSRLTGTAATLSAAGHSRWQGRTRLRRVLLRWQAPQPCRSRPGCHRGPGGLTPTSFPRRRGGVPSYPACLHLSRSCPPEGGRGAAAPGGALRAIDPSAWPRSWRTFGQRRRRRQSEPALVATQGGTAAATPPSPTRRVKRRQQWQLTGAGRGASCRLRRRAGVMSRGGRAGSRARAR